MNICMKVNKMKSENYFLFIKHLIKNSIFAIWNMKIKSIFNWCAMNINNSSIILNINLLTYYEFNMNIRT